VQEAKQRVENLSAERVATELERGDAILIDLREPNEQAQHGYRSAEHWLEVFRSTTGRC
jgi:hypothetical protein